MNSSSFPSAFSNLPLFFGGTFDPPHFGHVFLLKEIIQTKIFSEILIHPTYTPLLKKTRTAFSYRYQMAKKAFTPLNSKHTPVHISDTEYKQQCTCTYELLLWSQTKWPACVFLLGTDQFEQFPKWKHFPKLLSLAHWIVIKRAKKTICPQTLQKFLKKKWLIPHPAPHTFQTPSGTYLHVASTQAPPFSSRKIRALLKKNHPKSSILSLIPKLVWHEIQKKHLYSSSLASYVF